MITFWIANLAQLGPNLAPTWPQLGLQIGSQTQLAPNLAQLGANLAQLGPILAPIWPQLGPTWPHLGPNFAPTWHQLGPNVPQLGCSWLLLAAPGCSSLLLAAPGCLAVDFFLPIGQSHVGRWRRSTCATPSFPYIRTLILYGTCNVFEFIEVQKVLFVLPFFLTSATVRPTQCIILVLSSERVRDIHTWLTDAIEILFRIESRIAYDCRKQYNKLLGNQNERKMHS